MKTRFYPLILLFSVWMLAFLAPASARSTSVNANFLLSAGPEICLGEQIFFNNISFGATRFIWKINGVIFSEAQDTSYSFLNAGTFDITLVASDSACSDSLTRQLVVISPPNRVYNVTPQTCPGDMDGMIDLTLSGGNPPFVVAWTTGDTTEDIASLDSGKYILTLRDSVGCVLRDTVRVPSLGGLEANFQILVLNAFVRLTDLSDTTALQWEWDLGDGTQYTLQNPTHTFSANGQYTICLTVTDSAGCTSMFCETVSITSTAVSGQLEEKPKVYYDLTSKTLQIEFPYSLREDEKASVWDLQGRLILEESVKVGTSNLQLDLSSLLSNVYWLRVKFSEKSFTFKIVIPY